MGIFQGQHEGERRERPYPLHLAQELGFSWVALFGDLLQLPLVVSDALGERSDLPQDGFERRRKRFGDVLLGSLVEASGRALGQARPEGFDRPLGTWFTSCVRHPTNACLERIKAM